MKVELSIADDRELRAHIRDVIKGEVLGIARGEIKTIIAEAVKQKAVPHTGTELDKIVRNEIKGMIRDVVKATYGKPNFIEKCIRQEVNKYLAEFFSKRGERLL